MGKKNITINDVAKSLDDLAILVKKGFDEINNRFDGVDKRFEQVDKHFDRIGAQLDRLERNQKIILLKLDGNARRHITK